jgi:hypothetical protein
MMKKNNKKVAYLPPQRGKVAFMPSLRSVTTRIGAYTSRYARDYLNRATETDSLLFAKKLSGIGTRVTAGRKELEMVANTQFDAAGGGADETPSLLETSTKVTSGVNGAYRAKVHKVHMVFGTPPSKGLRDLVRENGEIKKQITDTLSQVVTDGTRQLLGHGHGFNQKSVLYITPDQFGFDANSIWQQILEFPTHGTGTSNIQRVYAGITKLRSTLSVSNNNVMLPMNVKVSLIKQKNPDIRGIDIANEVINALSSTQEEGKMASLYQFSDRITNAICTFTNVDPRMNNIHSCPNAVANYEIVKSKTVRLSAGDHLQFTYDHYFRSGIDLRPIMAAREGATIEDNSMYTYALVLETWGPNVEALKLDASGNPVTPAVRWNGSAPGQFSMELSRHAYGAKGTATSTIGAGGFQAGPFAVRVFTDGLSYGTKLPTTNFHYTKLNANDGFAVPLLSDKDVINAGNRK